MMDPRHAFTALLLIILAAGSLQAAAAVGGQAVCPPAPTRTYVDVVSDAQQGLVTPFVYEITGSYDKTPLKNGLVYRVKLEEGSSASELCYGATDDLGVVKFPYDPQAVGCLDYWYIFCPNGDLTTQYKREMCLNGTGLPRNMISYDPVPRCDVPATAAILPRNNYMLSHNEFYFCNYPPEDFAPLCWPLMLILGLLLGASFAAGRNPFMAFDLSSPRLSRGRHYTTRLQQKRFDALGMIYGMNTAVDTGARTASVARQMTAKPKTPQKGKAGGAVSRPSLSQAISNSKGFSPLNWASGRLTGGITNVVNKLWGKKQTDTQPDNKKPSLKDKTRISKEGLEKLRGNVKTDQNVKNLENLRDRVNQTERVVDQKKERKPGVREAAIMKKLNISADKKIIDRSKGSNAMNVQRTEVRQVLFTATNLFASIKGLFKAIFGSREQSEAEKKYLNRIGGIALDLSRDADKGNWSNMHFALAFTWALFKDHISTQTHDQGRNIVDQIILRAFLNAMLAQSRYIGPTGIRRIFEYAYFAATPEALPVGLNFLSPVLTANWLNYKASLYSKDAEGSRPMGEFVNLSDGRICRLVTDPASGKEIYQFVDPKTSNTQNFMKDDRGNWVNLKTGKFAGTDDQNAINNWNNLDVVKNRGFYVAVLQGDGNYQYQSVSKDRFEEIKDANVKYNLAMGDLAMMTMQKHQFTQSDWDRSGVANSLYNNLYQNYANGLNPKADLTASMKFNAGVKTLAEEFIAANGLSGVGGTFKANDKAGMVMLFDLMLKSTDAAYLDMSKKATEEERMKYIQNIMNSQSRAEKLFDNARNMLELGRDMKDYSYYQNIANNRMQYANLLGRTDVDNFNQEVWKLELQRSALDASINSMLAFNTQTGWMEVVNKINDMTAGERKKEFDAIGEELKRYENEKWLAKMDAVVKDGQVDPAKYNSLNGEQKEYVGIMLEQHILIGMTEANCVGKDWAKDLFKDGKLDDAAYNKLSEGQKNQLLIGQVTPIEGSLYANGLVKQFDAQYSFYSTASSLAGSWKAENGNVGALIDAAYSNFTTLGNSQVETGYLSQVGSICSFDLEPYAKHFKAKELEECRGQLVEYYNAYLQDPTNTDKKVAFIGALASVQDTFAGVMITADQDKGLAGNKNALNYLSDVGKKQLDLNPLDNTEITNLIGKPGEPPKDLEQNTDFMKKLNETYVSMNEKYFDAINKTSTKDKFDSEFERDFNMKEISSTLNRLQQTLKAEDEHQKIFGGQTIYQSMAYGTENPFEMKGVYDKAYLYSDYYRQYVKSEMKSTLYGPGYLTDYDSIVNDQVNNARHSAMTDNLSVNIKAGIVSDQLQKTRNELQEIIEKNNALDKLGIADDQYMGYANKYESVRNSLPENVYKNWKNGLENIDKDNGAQYLDMSNRVVNDYLNHTQRGIYFGLDNETFDKKNEKLGIIQNSDEVLNYKHDNYEKDKKEYLGRKPPYSKEKDKYGDYTY